MPTLTKEDAFNLGEFDALWAESSKPAWKPDVLKKGEMTAAMYAEWLFQKTGKRISDVRAREILRGMFRNNRATRRDVRLESARTWQWAYLPANLRTKEKK